MDYYTSIEWALGLFCVGVLLYLISTRKTKPDFNTDAATFRDLDDNVERATAGDGYHYRTPPLVTRREDRAYGSNKYPRDHRTTFGKRVSNPTPHSFSARELTSINAKRKVRGKPPLTKAGFQRAINTAPHWVAKDIREGHDTMQSWLPWFMIYEAMSPHECSARTTMDSGMTTFNNGGGGEFAGAGASGGWDNPPNGSADPLSDPMSYKGNTDYASDSAPSYSSEPASEPASAPDPAPASEPYSAPDTSSNYSAPDTSSSFSSGGDGT